MRKYNTKEFVERAKEIHGDKYDYSKVEYINSQTKVCIICPEHGEFWQIPANHLQGDNCPKCSSIEVHNKQRFNTEEFITRAREIHGDKYDYSKVEYINNKTKICIICPEHGEFWQRPYKHLYCGRGCPRCGNTTKLTTKEFIEKAKKIHNNKYNYSKTNYITTEKKVCIICPEHGEFWQTPHSHLNGEGCPICKQRFLEKEIREFLINNNITFEYQKKFKWLGRQSLDFYLPEYNIAIECQGKQHFEPVEFFGGKEKFKYQIKMDLRKKELCETHNITIIYYTKHNKNFISTVEELKNILYES